ncbi:MAG: hypothetical protein L0211_12300 [Planctomycetaceae bacterium]|nr:hypothetical protein [Planctomycetaceae bacterium]
MTELDTDLLAALVAARLKILELLVQLAREQLVLADRGATSQLLKLLAAKQAVLAQLRAVQSRLDPFQLQDPEARLWRSPADRQRCQQEARRCEELLAESMRLEQQSELAMVHRRDRAAGVLAGAASATEAHAAYAGCHDSPPAALHLHCEG